MLILVSFACLMLNLLCLVVAPNIFTAVCFGITVGTFLGTVSLRIMDYKL